jgi:hypothetical protein
LLGFVDPAQKELHQRLQNSGGKCRALTLNQIEQATQNFKTTIGLGGFGEVYYGKLVNGQEIAVKTLSTTSHQTKHEFFNEVTKFYLCKFLMLKVQRNCLDSYVHPYYARQIHVVFTISCSTFFCRLSSCLWCTTNMLSPLWAIASLENI